MLLDKFLCVCLMPDVSHHPNMAKSSNYEGPPYCGAVAQLGPWPHHPYGF